MFASFSFSFHGCRHVLVSTWEARTQSDEFAGWVRVDAFMARVIVKHALRDDPQRFKSYILDARHQWTGLDYHSPHDAWEAYVDERIANDWMPTHVLFEHPRVDFAVNVPVVAPVAAHAPEPTEWIEIAFVDRGSNPVPNVTWSVELADGRVMNGVTGNNGLFRTTSGPPGTARLTYKPEGLRSLQQLTPPGFHTVRLGQDIVSIAWAYGHADWNTVWDHAQNEDARSAHETPTLLHPGTRLFVPECEQPTASYAMGQRHEVVVDPPTQTLALVLEGAYEDELSGARYTLEVGSTLHGGVVASSVVELTVPLGTSTGKLSIWLDDNSVDPDGDQVSEAEEPADSEDAAEADEQPPDFEAVILLNQLRPASELRGTQGRLRNLGLYGGAVDDILGVFTHGALRLLAGEPHTGDAVSDDARRALKERHE